MALKPELAPELIQELRCIVGDAQVIPADRVVDMEPFTHDATEDLRFTPQVGLRPGSTGEVAAIMRLASREGIPVTPQGGMTGLSGGALPVTGGFALSLGRMDAILEIDEANRVAVVQAGCILQRIQEAAGERGLFYPPDPASRGSCQLGGNVAENAAGGRSLKYGSTRDYVLGLTAVLPDGEILRTGGKLRKNATGYDLTHTIIGSEGTLAVVTEVTLRLIPAPTHRRVLLVPFDSVDAATRALAEVFRRRITPSAAEFMEQAAMKATEAHLGRPFPCSCAAAALLFEVDGADDEGVEAQALVIAEVCDGQGAGDAILADTQPRCRELWALRHAMGEAVTAASADGVKKEEDAVVPVAALPDLMREVEAVRRAHGVDIICFGHAGDGNIHCNVLRGRMSPEEWQGKFPDAIPDLFRRVVALGGTITGEHGIGWVQREYLPIAVDAGQVALWRRLKAAFDPAGILNPGKIFPEG